MVLSSVSLDAKHSFLIKVFINNKWSMDGLTVQMLVIMQSNFPLCSR